MSSSMTQRAGVSKVAVFRGCSVCSAHNREAKDSLTEAEFGTALGCGLMPLIGTGLSWSHDEGRITL